MRRLLRTTALTLALALAGFGGLAGSRAALAAGGSTTLPASNGTLSGTTRSFDLWAKSGTTSLPGYPAVPVLGYVDTAAGTVTAPGGPPLVVTSGETVQITLHNTLSAASALNISGQPLAADLTGAAAAGTRTYSFVAGQPGTFLYEAGVTGSGPRQTALGLYGALVVRPAGHANWAYGAASAFSSEALLLVSAVDPAFNQNPAAFDMRTYAPKIWLLNGAPFAGSSSVPVHRGGALLLRQINAGITHEPIGLLGIAQTVIAEDGRALLHPYAAVSETLGAGQTQDALVQIGAATPLGRRYPLANTGNPANTSGVLALITVADLLPPVVSGLSVTPSPTNSASVTLSANADDATSGNTGVTSAEYQLDGGAWTAAALSGTNASATISTGGLSDGSHTLQVRATDGAGNLSAPVSTSFVFDTTAPTVTGLTLAPNPASVGASVALSASASDASTAVASVQYQVNGGPWTSAALSGASVSATIATGGLTPGNYVVGVRAADSVGNTSVPVTITLTVNPLVLDTTPPVVSGVSFALSAPNASGGTLSASATDAVGVSTASYRVDGGAWTSFTLTAGPSVSLSAALTGLSNGSHTFDVRAADAAGNVSTSVSTSVVVDTLAPSISASVAPALTNAAASVTLTGSAADGSGTGVSSTEYRVDGGAWAACTLGGTSISTSGLADGSHTVDVRATDARGNVGTASSSFIVNLFADGFEGGLTLPGAWSGVAGTTTGANAKITVTTGAALLGSNGLRVTAVNGSNGYVSRSIGSQSGLRARFRVNPNGATFGGNNVDLFRVRAAGSTAASVQLRLNSGNYQVRLLVARLGGTSATAWVTLAAGSNSVEVVWARGGSTTATLIVNGAAQPNLTALNTNAFTADQFWFGLIGNNSGGGAVFLDAFASTRGSPILP